MAWVYSGETMWYWYTDNTAKIRAWVHLMPDGTYVVDSWNAKPPPHGPFETLDAAKMAAEMMYG